MGLSQPKNGLVANWFLIDICLFNIPLGHILAARVRNHNNSSIELFIHRCIRLPLDSVMLLISELLPNVQELQASRHRANSTSIIVDFLSTVSLKHVLPEAPVPMPRRFMVCVSLVHRKAKSQYRRTVVRCFYCLVNFPHMGRNICEGYDTSRYMERNECPFILRQTYPKSTETDHGNRLQCCWWVS